MIPRLPVFLIALGLSLSAPAQTTSPSDPFESQLRAIDAAAGRIKDLSAHFEQKKFTALLKKPLISSGAVRATGAQVRWDTDQPQACVLYADQQSLKLFYPDQKLEEIYPMDQRWSDLLSSPLPRLAAIERHFSIRRATENELTHDLPAVAHQPDSLPLFLSPTDPELARQIQQVIVVLDEKAGLTRAVQTTDGDGDQTQMIFSAAHTGVGLSPRDLELMVPAGTSVSHPLDAAPSPSSHRSP